MPPASLSARSISKTFGETLVLDSVDLDILPGQVRGLLGQNGSGKSTFIKILAGYHAPDPGGQLRVAGTEVALPVAPQDLAAAGIGFMHQDLGLEESMTVLENYLIDGRGGLRPVHWKRRTAEVGALLGEYGLDVDPRSRVSDLTPGQRAVLALARAVRHVSRDDGVLVLDEPTASLDRDGVDLLFGAVRRLTSRGASVLFVGHNLDEALRLCDDVTVLRDGKQVGDAATSSLDEEVLVRMIIGRDIGQVYPDAAHEPTNEIVLAVEGLTGDVVRDVSFNVHRGEIVGLTGLAGMGHDEVPQLIFGHHAPLGGHVSLSGESLAADPTECLRRGVVLISGDRKRLGVNGEATVAENVGLPVLGRYFADGRIRHKRLFADVQSLLSSFDVRPPDGSLAMAQLSGGNQQKALVGKWLSLYDKARVLLLAEPVQGVDVAARQAIFRHVRQAADSGIGVVYVSSEHDDLANLCDRVLVLKSGSITAQLHGAQLTQHQLTAACLRAG